MIKPKNETEGLLLSITKNCQKFIEQTHTKVQETLEFKLTKPKETFSFKRPIWIEGSSMIGQKKLKIYNSFLKKNRKEKQIRTLWLSWFKEC